MRKLSIVVLTFFFVITIGCDENRAGDTGNLTWHPTLEKALKIAKEENKYVLVNFTGSDWCKWCKKLNAEVFTQKAFEDYAKENLVLVKLDFPQTIEQSPQTKQYNNSMMYKYGVRGFPTILLFNSNGKGIAKTGYRAGGAKEYVKHLEQIFANS